MESRRLSHAPAPAAGCHLYHLICECRSGKDGRPDDGPPELAEYLRLMNTYTMSNTLGTLLDVDHDGVSAEAAGGACVSSSAHLLRVHDVLKQRVKSSRDKRVQELTKPCSMMTQATSEPKKKSLRCTPYLYTADPHVHVLATRNVPGESQRVRHRRLTCVGWTRTGCGRRYICTWPGAALMSGVGMLSPTSTVAPPSSKMVR